MDKFQCCTIQFRDHNLTDTNEDTVFDKLGQFYGKMANLDEELQTLNETVVMDSKFNETIAESKSELIVTVEPSNDTVIDEIDEYESPVRWCPPTPPKATPPKGSKPEISDVAKNFANEDSTTNITAPLLFSSIIDEDSRTPTPPQLFSMVNLI